MTIKRWTALLAAWGLGASLIATTAVAAETAPPRQRAAALQSILACRSIAGAEQRLACFDATTATFDKAEAAGDLVVLDREQATRVRKEIFGLPLPALALFGGGEGRPASEDVDRITDTVKTASQDRDGRWVIELEGGAVWRQTEAGFARVRTGSQAEVRKGALGSYFMKVDGQTAIRVRRDR